jgi:hypothetical protein
VTPLFPEDPEDFQLWMQDINGLRDINRRPSQTGKEGMKVLKEGQPDCDEVAQAADQIKKDFEQGLARDASVTYATSDGFAANRCGVGNICLFPYSPDLPPPGQSSLHNL